MSPTTNAAGKMTEAAIEAEIANKLEKKLEKSLEEKHEDGEKKEEKSGEKDNSKEKNEKQSEEKKNKTEEETAIKQNALLDKERKAFDNNSRNEKKAFDRINDLRQGPTQRTRWSNAGLTFLVIISIFAYIVDFTTDFARPPNYVVILAYGLMIILAMIFSRKFLDEDITGLFIAIVATFLIPWIVHFFQANIPYQWMVDILGMFLFFPPVFVYMLAKYPEHSVGNVLYKIIIAIIIIYIFIQFLASPTIQGTLTSGKATIQEPTYIMKAFFGNVAKAVTGVFTNADRSFKMAMARATGQQYDSSEEEQRGVIIEKVTAVEKNYYTSSEVYVQGKIAAKNLVGEVTVRTTCYIKDKGYGSTYPELISMVNNDENIIDCHLGKLPKGSYQIFVGATFVFQTDADIQYYFVDEKTRPELYASLNIPENALATYTGGPIELGLPSLNQPLRISSDATNNKVGNYPYGVSLTNKWTEGKVTRGLNYSLEIPAGVKLENCNRKVLSEGTTQDERTRYIFQINENNVRETFDSVTCRMRVIDSERLFNGDIVAQKTFNARAVYEYTVEESIYVQIVDDYTT